MSILSYLPGAVIVRLPLKVASPLLGESFEIPLAPEDLAGEVSIKRKFWLCPPGDWDLAASDIREKSTFAVMRAAIAGPDSAEWRTQQMLLMAKDRPVRRTKSAFFLDSEESIERYLIYCRALATAVEKGALQDADNRVRLGLGRDGQLYKTGDGRHRISAATLLGKPVSAQIRHLHPQLLRDRARLRAVLRRWGIGGAV